jgi:hypothetical protein
LWEAGSDWRSLNRLRVEHGQLAEYRLAPDADWHAGVLGVRPWNAPMGTITGNARPATGAYNVADPRRGAESAAFGQYGVKKWHETSQAVIGKAAVGSGAFAVADPRHEGPEKFNNVYRVVKWERSALAVTSSRDVAVADPRATDAMFHNAFKTVGWNEASPAITGQHAPSNGAMCVADRAPTKRQNGAIGIVDWDEPSGAIAAETLLTSDGDGAVADPRPNLRRKPGDAYLTAGHYGVAPRTGAVSSSGQRDNGPRRVADPRVPAPSDRLIAVIRSIDGTWHRPMTTLELAALQSLVDPEEHLELDGLSDTDWRERIGNAVPPDAATAIANTIGTTLLLAWGGAGFMLSGMPIWVQPVAVALSIRQAGE